MRSIDLNADMGEYANDAQSAIEAALMPLISSCSIACGGHAGNQVTMHHTIALARKHSVSIGAHPSYPDREGFGRRRLKIEPAALLKALKEQVAALAAILDETQTPLRHIKPHGALYNDAAANKALAEIVVAAAGDATIVGPPGSAMEECTKEAGKNFVAEGFVDRLYLQSGALTPRELSGAVIEGNGARARQARAIASGARFAAADGMLTVIARTLCIHSDSPGAVETARAVRKALEADGFTIRAAA